MTLQDFELIAKTIRGLKLADQFEQHGEDNRRYVAKCFAADLASTNPNFNRARFLKACGVED